MIRLQHITRAAALVVAIGSLEAVEAQNLRELAREHAIRHPGQPMVQPSPPGPHDPKSIDELTIEADVVIQGRLQRLRSYFSDAENRVMTNFRIVGAIPLAGQLTSVPSARPGESSLVLTVTGGDSVIEGVPLRTTSETLNFIKEGRDYLLFLRQFEGERGRYFIHNGGVFDLAGGAVTPLVRLGHEFFKDSTLNLTPSQAVSRIRAAKGR